MAAFDLAAVRARAAEHAEHQARMGWQCCRSHASADDVPALLAENERLLAEVGYWKNRAQQAEERVGTWCQCCDFGNHTMPCTCSSARCCHSANAARQED